MVLTIDNFLPHPLREREIALSAKYQTIEHNGLNYRGISFTKDEDTFKRIEHEAGEKFVETECFYRRYLADEVGETYIHNDVLIGTFTAILFLNLDELCMGGTAFWRNKQYGWDHHPTKEELQRQGIPNSDWLWKTIYKDGFQERKWELLEMVPMKFNRLIIFPSQAFHSRYPQNLDGLFGMEVSTARLIKTFFGKTANHAHLKTL